VVREESSRHNDQTTVRSDIYHGVDTHSTSRLIAIMKREVDVTERDVMQRYMNTWSQLCKLSIRVNHF